MGHEGRCSQLYPHLNPPALSVQLTFARLLLHSSNWVPLSVLGDSGSNAELATLGILIVPLDPANHDIITLNLSKKCLWKAISIANALRSCYPSVKNV